MTRAPARSTLFPYTTLFRSLVLGLGTANQETVTILSVGTTSPGWTTATITLQAATTKSHTSGDTVCEPLPTGVKIGEHTSELQSRRDLVCRLLLEKKKRPIS